MLALTQFLMVFVLGILYLRRSEKVYDPLAERAIAAYADHDADPAPSRLADVGGVDAAAGAGAVSASPEVRR